MMTSLTDLLTDTFVFQARVEGEEWLRRVLEMFFGADASLSFRARLSVGYWLTLAGPTGWCHYDRHHNNTPASHAHKIIEWRESLGYKTVEALARPSYFEGATRTTAYLVTFVRDYDSGSHLEIIPAWA
jgi:hypothetical protein